MSNLTTVEKVEAIYEAIEDIKEAIAEKGVTVPDPCPISAIADLISLIGTSDELILTSQNSSETLTIAEKVEAIYEAIEDIKEAIAEKGVTVPDPCPIASIPDLISLISDEAPVYGVSGLYQSNPLLIRTDDAVGMNFEINDLTGEIASDFNNVFPFNVLEIVTNEAGKFVKFPEMWFRVGADSSSRITDIAVSRAPRETGNWYRVDPFLYGCYCGSVSNDVLKSVSRVVPKTQRARADFRAYAAANGTGFRQLDLYHYTVLLFLWLIEFATKNSSSVMTGRISGSGSAGGSSLRNTGGTDNVTSPSGYETVYGQMRFHYIEDFVGNLMEFIDGVCCKGESEHDYVTDDSTNFSDDVIGKNALSFGVPSNGCVASFGWDDENPFMCTTAETVTNTNYDTFFCDALSGVDDDCPVLTYGSRYGAAVASIGLTRFYRYSSSYSNSSIGGRLIKTL